MIKLDWSRRYCNKAIVIIKRCFTWAARKSLSRRSLTGSFRSRGSRKAAQKPGRKPSRSRRDDDGRRDPAKVSSWSPTFCRLMRLTGMRPGEASSMTAAEIDRTDPSCWIYRPGHHKTAHQDKGGRS